ncbi:MAG: nucleoside 2-deoxyribosyltransferase, partial [Liquorilactobacillus hordei]
MVKTKNTRIKEVVKEPFEKINPQGIKVGTREFVVTVPQKTYYHGAGWFTPKQEKAYDEFSKALEANLTLDSENSYVPLEHQYKNIRVDEHPEYLHDKEWA